MYRAVKLLEPEVICCINLFAFTGHVPLAGNDAKAEMVVVENRGRRSHETRRRIGVFLKWKWRTEAYNEINQRDVAMVILR